jgi:hypothetical protein
LINQTTTAKTGVTLLNGGTRHGDQATHNSKNRRDTVRKNHDEKFLKRIFK